MCSRVDREAAGSEPFFFLTCGARKPLPTVPPGRRAALLPVLPAPRRAGSPAAPAHLLAGPRPASLPRPPARPPPPRTPGRAGCLRGGPVTCRGSCTGRLALRRSGLCCLLGQITEIPLGMPAFPLPLALQDRVQGRSGLKLDPLGHSGRERRLPFPGT